MANAWEIFKRNRDTMNQRTSKNEGFVENNAWEQFKREKERKNEKIEYKDPSRVSVKGVTANKAVASKEDPWSPDEEYRWNQEEEYRAYIDALRMHGQSRDEYDSQNRGKNREESTSLFDNMIKRGAELTWGMTPSLLMQMQEEANQKYGEYLYQQDLMNRRGFYQDEQLQKKYGNYDTYSQNAPEDVQKKTAKAAFESHDTLNEAYASYEDYLRNNPKTTSFDIDQSTWWGKTLAFLEDAGAGIFEGGFEQWAAGFNKVLDYADRGANGAAAWALRDLAKAVPEGTVKNWMLTTADDLETYYTGESKSVYAEGAEIRQKQLQSTMQEITRGREGIDKWVIEQMPSAGNMLFNVGASTALTSAIGQIPEAGMSRQTGMPQTAAQKTATMAERAAVAANNAAVKVAQAGTSSLAMLGATAGGSAALEAQQNGASDTQALLYGIAAGGMEVFSEKLFGGNPLYDTDAGLVNQLASKLGASKTIMKLLDGKVFGIASEGLEEVVTEVIDPVFEAVIYNGKNTEFATVDDIASAFAGGVFLSLVGNVTNLPNDVKEARYKKAAKNLAAQAEAIDDAQVQRAAQAVKEQVDMGRTPDAESIGDLLSAMENAGATVDTDTAAETAQEADAGITGNEPWAKEMPQELLQEARDRGYGTTEAVVLDSTYKDHTKHEKNPLSPKEYAKRFDAAYIYGKSGTSLTATYGKKEVRGLTRPTIKAAHELGVQAYQAAPYRNTSVSDQTQDDYIAGLNEKLASGEISEREYDRAFDEYYQGGESEAAELRQAQAVRNETTQQGTNGQQTATRGATDGKYSIKNTRNMPYQQQVKGYFQNDGSIKTSDSLYLGTSGAEMAKKGISDAPMYIPTSVINKAVREAKGSRSGHGLNETDIEGLQEGIKNAAAVVYNPGRNAIVYLTGRECSDGGYLVASFSMNQKLFGENAHKATSIHSRESVDGLLNNLGEDATVYVRDKEKLNRMLSGTGIQSSQLLANVEFMDGSIAEQKGEVKNETGESVLYEGGKRTGRADTAVAAGIVEESTGRNQSREESTRAIREKVDLENQIRDRKIGKVSTRAAGVPGGTQSEIVTVVPNDIRTETMQEAERFLKAEGFEKVKFVLGAMEIRDGRSGQVVKAEGFIDGANVWIRADSKLYTMHQLAAHESFHLASQMDQNLRSRLANRLMEEYGVEFDAMIAKYIEAYQGCYGLEDPDSWDYIEEILADAYAGMNRKNLGADKYEKIVNEEVNQNKSQRETGAERKTGPPEKNSYAMSQNEQDSVKEQLREYQDRLNTMTAVATISDNGWKGMNTGDFRKKIVSDLKKTGYRVDNPDIGVIEFDEKLLNRSMNYIQTDADAAAYQAIPQVLKRGTLLSGHEDHKGRGYETVTIAAPVELNGKRGNMAVVVMKTKGNRYKVHRILTPEGKAFELPEMANAESTSAGGITEAAKATGAVTPTIDSASGISITENGMPVKGKLSVADTKLEDSQEANDNRKTAWNTDKEQRDIDEFLKVNPDWAQTIAEIREYADGKAAQRKNGLSDAQLEDMPKKGIDALRRARNRFTYKVSSALQVPVRANRNFLRSAVNAMMEAYMKTGEISQETKTALFEAAYEKGVVIDDEFYNQYKDVKKKLKDTAVTISEQDKADIADFALFKKQTSRTLNIRDSGGLPVDVFYQEMRETAPELFPEGITHPADQLQKLYEAARSIEVSKRSLDEYYGAEKETFKAWARGDFEQAAAEMESQLAKVRRFAEDQTTKEEQAPEITTVEQANEAYQELKRARREYEKANAKNLLTKKDKLLVDKLVRGEIGIEAIADEQMSREITEVYEAAKDYRAAQKRIEQYRKGKRSNLMEKAKRDVGNAALWKDKKGIRYMRETQERNIRDIAPDAETAERIIRDYIRPVHQNNAEATRMKNEYRERVKKLNVSRVIEKGNIISEAAAVQMIGEAEDNIRVLEKDNRFDAKRDGKTLQEWQAVVQKVWKENPNLNKAKVNKAIQDFRTIYDELFQKMNEVRVRNGYEPVNYRQGYFPHFQPGQTDGIISLFAKAMGIDAEVTALPTSINGLTHTFRPGIQWFGPALERIGYNTAYDAVEGFDRYIEGVADVVWHTDDIQRLRALERAIRYLSTDEGIREQIDAVERNDALTMEQKEAETKRIFENAKFALGNFAVDLSEYTNLLANKKHSMDRRLERLIGREWYNLAKGLENRVAANMVAINPASWLTNFIPLTQAGMEIDTKSMLEGMWQTLKAYKTDDGFAGSSTFLTNRRGSDPLVKTWGQRTSETLSKPMEYIDTFTADSIVRARYLQNVKRGMSEEMALTEADEFAAGVMADRSKGSMPTIFGARNPVIKLFSQFQLEVNNQLSWLFKDVPREMKDRGLKVIAAAIIKYVLGAFLYNEVYEYFIGRRPALDPIGILNDTVGDFTGYELPNLVAFARGEDRDFRTEKKSALTAMKNVVDNFTDNIPGFDTLSGLVGMEGGRVPFSSSLPDVKEAGKALLDDDMSWKKRAEILLDEAAKPLAHWILPFGGGQIKKLAYGIEAVARGGSYSVDSEGNDILQYPVFNETTGQKVGGAAKAVFFGKSALKGAQEWVESGFKSLSAKQTSAYKAMIAAGEGQMESWDVIDTIRKTKKTEDKSQEANQKQALAEAAISDAAKVACYYALFADEEEQAKIETFVQEGLNMDAYLQYQSATAGIEADKDSKGEPIDGTKKRKVMEAINALDVTDEQKDFLVEAAGYKPTVLTPWKYMDYAKFEQAVRTGKGMRDMVKEALKAGAEPGDITEIVTMLFKDEYINATAAERADLKARIITVAEVMGGTSARNSRAKAVDKWLEKDED